MWDVANVVLTGNFIAPNSYIRKEGKSQENNLTFQITL